MKILKSKLDLDFKESKKRKPIKLEEKKLKLMSMRDTFKRKHLNMKSGKDKKDSRFLI